MRKEIEEKIEEKKEEKWEKAKEEARIYSDKQAEISKEDYEKKEKHRDSVKQ